MPAQQRRRLDQQRTRTRQRLAERGEHDTVGWARLRPGDLTPQHLQLVPQQQDLDLLSLLRASEQEHQLEQSAQQPVAEAKGLKQQRTSTHARTLRADHLSLSRQQRGRPEPRMSFWDRQVSKCRFGECGGVLGPHFWVAPPTFCLTRARVPDTGQTAQPTATPDAAARRLIRWDVRIAGCSFRTRRAHPRIPPSRSVNEVLKPLRLVVMVRPKGR
jgi:hypothetical protein